MSLAGLNDLAELATNKDKPTQLDYIYYLFWDKGMGENDVNEMSIPYILSIIKTHSHVQKEQEKEMKKGSKKGTI